MENKIKATISYIFGKYDMRHGANNRLRMKLLFDFCMSDLESYPDLEELLQTKEAMEFFVIQSMIYMLPLTVENNISDKI